jgi:hypothetical protein
VLGASSAVISRVSPPKRRGSPLDAGALAAAPGGLAGLLPALDRGLHVVAAALELAEDALGGHLALEVLDRALDALVTDGDLEGLADDGLAGGGNRGVVRNGQDHIS